MNEKKGEQQQQKRSLASLAHKHTIIYDVMCPHLYK